MKTPFFRIAAAVTTAAAALSLVSCEYDPYYGGGGYSAGYSSYGGGYYGGGSSVFISTSSSNWGYDPNTYCYYDYGRRAYYDPYLYGYYPVGYRPPIVYGVPHPYGWRPGRGMIPPPRVIRGGWLPNYNNRADLYRNRGFDWSRNVRAGSGATRFTPPTSPGVPRSNFGQNASFNQPRPPYGQSQYGTQFGNNRGNFNQSQFRTPTQQQIYPQLQNRTPGQQQVRPQYQYRTPAQQQTQPQFRQQNVPSYQQQNQWRNTHVQVPQTPSRPSFSGNRPSFNGGGSGGYQPNNTPRIQPTQTQPSTNNSGNQGQGGWQRGSGGGGGRDRR